MGEATNGKGDRRRPEDKKKFNNNYDKIFKEKAVKKNKKQDRKGKISMVVIAPAVITIIGLLLIALSFNKMTVKTPEQRLDEQLMSNLVDQRIDYVVQTGSNKFQRFTMRSQPELPKATFMDADGIVADINAAVPYWVFRTEFEECNSFNKARDMNENNSSSYKTTLQICVLNFNFVNDKWICYEPEWPLTSSNVESKNVIIIEDK